MQATQSTKIKYHTVSFLKYIVRTWIDSWPGCKVKDWSWKRETTRAFYNVSYVIIVAQDHRAPTNECAMLTAGQIAVKAHLKMQAASQ